MKRTLAITATILCVALMACDPAPTITATPSTTRPACKQVTTVTGKVAPANALETVWIERQLADGTWKKWEWFANSEGSTTKTLRQTSVGPDETWTITYAPPQPGTATIRLRARGVKKLLDPGVASASWYVKPPSLPCP